MLSLTSYLLWTDSLSLKEQSLFMTGTGAEEIWEGVWKNAVSKDGL